MLLGLQYVGLKCCRDTRLVAANIVDFLFRELLNPAHLAETRLDIPSDHIRRHRDLLSGRKELSDLLNEQME
jgi:hypothetical protein